MNLLKYLFLKRLTDLRDVRMVKKESKYVFLVIERLNFLNVVDYSVPALDYHTGTNPMLAGFRNLHFRKNGSTLMKN